MTNALRPLYAPTVVFGDDFSNVTAKGEKGDPGQSGNTILAGSGAPSNGVGNNGDFYIDYTNKLMYGPKSADTWPAGFSIVGVTGLPGTAGTSTTLRIGTVTTGAPGSQAQVVNVGTAHDVVLNFTIPAPTNGVDGQPGAQGAPGAAGAAATISIGTITTGAPGSQASVTNSGTTAAAVFDFTLPAGPAGADGQGVPTGGTLGQVLTKTGPNPLDTAWQTPTGGGLADFSDTKSATSPNLAIPVVSLIGTSTEANVDIALKGKGNFAFFLGAPPDNGVTGGNKRGRYSVDLQTARAAADSAAIGDQSVIGGGYNNAAPGGTSAILGGSNNISSGSSAACIGGESNTASGDYAMAGGTSNIASGSMSGAIAGQSNIASGLYATISGGSQNAVSGTRSTCPGGGYATDRGISGSYVHANGRFAANGDAQRGTLLLRTSTSDTTPTVATSIGAGTPSPSNTLVLPNGMTYLVRGRVLARSSAGVSSSWVFDAVVSRGAGAGTTALVGTVTPTVQAQDSGASSWSLAVTADTTLGGLSIACIGDASSAIRWLVQLDSLQVGY